MFLYFCKIIFLCYKNQFKVNKKKQISLNCLIYRAKDDNDEENQLNIEIKQGNYINILKMKANTKSHENTGKTSTLSPIKSKMESINQNLKLSSSPIKESIFMLKF